MRDIDWTFDGTWPFAPRWFSTPQGRLHYVDEGPRDGRPVVLVHGNPTWGYLYRRFVPALVGAGFRVIAVDHLGFGRSDKPREAAAYRIEGHAERMATLLDELDLQAATLVLHDWAGPITLDWATRRPERVAALVLLDTFLHAPLARVSMPLPLRLFRIPGLGALLVAGLHLVVRAFLFRAGVVHRERLRGSPHAAYLAPHPSWSSRAAILALAREFPAGPDGRVADFARRVQARLPALAERPVLLAWGDHDALFGAPAMARWRDDFPRAETFELAQAGHFVTEDAHERLVPELLAFLARA